MYEKFKKGEIWEWGRGQQEAFGRVKKLPSSPKFLVHYSLDPPVIVIADTSSYGLGAVISHRVDGQDRPIAFTSRTLIKAEKNYFQLDKEALALVSAVKKFKQYLYGNRVFILTTDFKPLLGLLGKEKPAHDMAFARMQGWALPLLTYK